MSKANFYRIPVKAKVVHAPRRRQRSEMESRGSEAWRNGAASDESFVGNMRQRGHANEPGAA